VVLASVISIFPSAFAAPSCSRHTTTSYVRSRQKYSHSLPVSIRPWQFVLRRSWYFQILHSPNPIFFSFTAASAACWHSHFTLLRRIADGDDDVALIFEDDIDMEWDLEKRLRYLWKFLPDKAWDQVMIGPSGIYFSRFKRCHS